MGDGDWLGKIMYLATHSFAPENHKRIIKVLYKNEGLNLVYTKEIGLTYPFRILKVCFHCVYLIWEIFMLQKIDKSFPKLS
jgi:hypothetical protein